MVHDDHPDETEKEHIKQTNSRKGAPTGATDGADGDRPLLNRRSALKTGATAAAGMAGAVNAVGLTTAEREVSSGGEYETWTISGEEVYDLSDGEALENVLIDQTADGANLTIRSQNKSGWEVRNVGFMGSGKDGDHNFQFQVSAPSGGTGLIENVWANGKERGDQESTELGGIYIRSSHAGHIDIRHTYIEGFGGNGVYASAVGKDGGEDGSVVLENCYHRDNTSSQFRIGSPDSAVRNCVAVVNDPEGKRGSYQGTGNRNARGIWAKHFRDQQFEDCAVYVSPDDVNPGPAFNARYIGVRSHGEKAVAEVSDCDVNEDAPTLTGTTSNAEVNFTNLGESPTVDVIQDGGVPTSPEMAARGEREMPPSLPGESEEDSDRTVAFDRTVAIDGADEIDTVYEVAVSGEIENDPDIGTFNDNDSTEGSIATGSVYGGVDGYRFSGEIVSLELDGEAKITFEDYDG